MAQLEIKNLSKAFSKTVVLDDVSLSVEKGDVYGILGLSGAGKSTLVRCVNGLERPDSGSVLYEGKVISAKETKPDASTRRKIAMNPIKVDEKVVSQYLKNGYEQLLKIKNNLRSISRT